MVDKRKKPQKRANGTGSLRWDDKRQYLIGQVTVREPGKDPYRKTVYGDPGDNSPEQRLKVDAKLQALLRPRNVGKGTNTLRHFLDKYAGRKELAATTRTQYQHLVEKHLATLGRKRLIDVTVNDIIDALDAIKGARTRQQARFVLRGTFQEAVYRQIIDRNTVNDTKPVAVKPAKRKRLFTREQLPYLLKAASTDRLGALVPLSLTTTLGPAEQYGLQRRDLDLGSGVVHVERDCVEAKVCVLDHCHESETCVRRYRPILGPVKREKRDREVHLPPVAVAALRDHLQRNGMLVMEGDGSEQVFTAPEGGLIRHRQLRARWWLPLLKRAAALAADEGVAFPTDLTPYALRHTAREIMSDRKVDYDLLSKRMGHSRLSTTFENYNTEVWAERDRAAASQIQGFFDDLPEVG